MNERFTDDDVRRLLRRDVERAGSIRKWAQDTGLSATYVSQVLARDLPPGPRIAGALGFKDDGKRWVRPK